jgi:hypothetical protein
MTDITPEPAIGKLAEALAAAQAEFPTVPKTHTAQVKSDKGSYSYTYAGLADVTEAAMPILAKHGLSFTALPGGGQLTGMLLHSSGQSLAGSLPISGNTPQALGSSITYARRYLLGCMTGLVTDDDDDDGQASGPYESARPAAKARPKPQPAPETPKSQPAPDKALRTDAQSKALWTLASKVMPDKEKFRAWLSEGLGREVESTTTLTRTECAEAIDALTALLPVDGALIPSAS